MARDCRGVAAVEFAIIFPVLVLMLFGVIELSNYLMAGRKVLGVAHTVGDLIAREVNIDQNTLDDIYESAALIMAPFSSGDISIGVASIVFDAGGNPTLDWESNFASGSVANATTKAAGFGDAGESVILVNVTYSYTPIVSMVLTGTQTIVEEVYVRPRLVDYIMME